MNVGTRFDGTAPNRDRYIYRGIFLVSMGVLLLQITLTRIFSFTLWYHFAYVTISVALLGYGASGALLAVFPGLSGRSPAERLPKYALACGASIVIGLLVFANVPFHPFQMMTLMFTGKRTEIESVQYLYLVIYYLAVTAPFLFAGLCISVALKALSHQVSRLYFYDLTGAGVGCLSVVFVIWALGTPGAVVAAAVIVSLSGVMFAAARGRSQALVPAVGVLAVAVLGVGALRISEFNPSPEKFLYRFFNNPQNKTVKYTSQWTPIFRTDSFGFKNEEISRIGSYASWGVSPSWKSKAAKEAPKIRLITHDGDAGAVIYNFDGDLSKLEMFDHLILTTPYLLFDKPDVLVIGVGGGTDIVNAVKHGARHVTGIELDPVTVRLVKEIHADFAGHLYDRPDVTVIAGEGRSTLRHSQTKYDVIQMTGVDTLAALSTGAYVLSESYLYTTDAMHEFFDHLTPDGVISIVVADWAGGPSGFPRHTMRQLSLLLETFEQRGVEDPEKHMVVIATPEGVAQVSMLFKNSPFTPEEVARLQGFAEQMGFRVWALPGTQQQTVHSQYIHTPRNQRTAFLAKVPLILTPTSDDNPFFFNFYRWQSLGQNLDQIDVGHTLATGQIVMGMILALALLFSTILILVPLLVFQRQGLHTQGRWGYIAFFLGIGLGFIFIEISFIQRFVLFLGYPTYSLTVVLFSLLTYSGIGSYLTSRMSRPPEERFIPLFAALMAVSLGYLVLLPRLFHAFLGSTFALRVLIASAVLAPLGVVMGMFFPSGIQVVRRANIDFVPWAWGINGSASVVATVLAVILAMSFGFRFVTFAALGVYFVAVLGIRASARSLSTGNA